MKNKELSNECFKKIVRVISSCRTKEHVNTCEKMIKQIPDCEDKDDLLKLIDYVRKERIRF